MKMTKEMIFVIAMFCAGVFAMWGIKLAFQMAGIVQ